jgi:hypothetical protein
MEDPIGRAKQAHAKLRASTDQSHLGPGVVRGPDGRMASIDEF